MNLLRIIVAMVVTLVWAAVWVVAIVTHDYQGIGAITPVMLLVAGYLFAREAIKGLKGNKDA